MLVLPWLLLLCWVIVELELYIFSSSQAVAESSKGSLLQRRMICVGGNGRDLKWNVCGFSSDFELHFGEKAFFSRFPYNITRRQTPKLLSRSGRKMWNNSNAKSIQFDEEKFHWRYFYFLSFSLLRPPILRRAIMPSEGKVTKPISFHPLGNFARSENGDDELHLEKQSETREIMKIVNRRKSSPIKDCLLHWNLICEWFTPPTNSPSRLWSCQTFRSSSAYSLTSCIVWKE